MSSSGFTENYHFRGSYREATGTASMNGGRVGDAVYADIFSSTERDSTICHGC